MWQRGGIRCFGELNGVQDTRVTTGGHNQTGGPDAGQPQRPLTTKGKRPARRKKRRPDRKWSRRVRIALLATLPVLLLLSFGVLITYTRLLQGPISLHRMVQPIEQSMSSSLGTLKVKIDDAALVLAEDHTFQFRLINLSLLDSTGARVAAAPLASASLDFTALLTGNIVPSRIYLIDPDLLVTYRKSTGVSLQVASKLVSEPALISEGEVAPPSQAWAPTVDRSAGLNSAAPPQTGEGAQPVVSQRINIAQIITELNARARAGLHANASLKEIGVRNATVKLDYEGQRSEWLIAEAAVDLDQNRLGNTIEGAARVQSDTGPWLFSFRTVESERENVVRLSLSARDLVPSSISRAAPVLSLLRTLDMPVSLDATMQVTTTGFMEAATLEILLAPGKMMLPSISATPLQLDNCIFNVSYDGYQDAITLAPSTLRWSDSSLTVSGVARKAEANGDQPDGSSVWTYQLKSVDGRLAANEFGLAGVPIDTWQSTGSVSLDEGRLNIDSFGLIAAGIELKGKGTLQADHSQSSTNLEAEFNSKDLKIIPAIWPRSLAPGARTWFGKNVKQGHIASGTLKFMNGKYLQGEFPAGISGERRISVAVEAGDLAFTHDHATKPATVSRALLRIENEALEVTVPKVVVEGGASGDIEINAVRMSAADLFGPSPRSEIAFKVHAPINSAFDMAVRADPETWSSLKHDDLGVRGLVVGEFVLTPDLREDAQKLFELKSGKAQVKDFRLSKKVGSYAIRGGDFKIDVSDDAVNLTGDILINGVGAKLKAQHIVGGPQDKQPPIRIATTLDEADRRQLKLDINDVVQGDVPVELQVAIKPTGGTALHAAIDLTKADLLFAEVAWRKPTGRTMRAEFDVMMKDGGGIELQNIQAVGQGIAIEGWASIGADNLLREFYFPDFSVDTVTRLRLQGKQSAKRIWTISAVGPTYDGRTFFKSLFSAGDLSQGRPKPVNPSKGIDLDAQVENVIGNYGTSIRQMRLKISNRDGKLVALDGKAQLDNGKDIAVLLRTDNGRRTMFAETTDAGKIFKVVGFYPNMVGGRARLELDLDGAGDASQTGILWTENFRILGDEVASEVFASANATGPGGRRQVTRQVFDFSQLRMPFSVGHNQFVIKKSYLRGPVVGASLSGKVDYETRRVNLGGSYIPLQEINSALCGIPLLGEIFTGPKCEGILGMTFAVQGPMARPQVIVNPLSLVAPGIFREIFQLTNPSVSVTPRSHEQSGGSADSGVRSSSSILSGQPGGQSGQRGNSPTVDGWSSGTQ